MKKLAKSITAFETQKLSKEQVKKIKGGTGSQSDDKDIVIIDIIAP